MNTIYEAVDNGKKCPDKLVPLRTRKKTRYDPVVKYQLLVIK